VQDNLVQTFAEQLALLIPNVHCGRCTPLMLTTQICMTATECAAGLERKIEWGTQGLAAMVGRRNDGDCSRLLEQRLLEPVDAKLEKWLV